MKKKLLFLKNNPQEILHREKVNERLRFAAAHSSEVFGNDWQRIAVRYGRAGS